eukprot:4329743-Amphidinium_carterae.1
MEGVFYGINVEEEKPADSAVCAEGERTGDQSEEPKTKMPRTEFPNLTLGPGIQWDPEWVRPPVHHRVFDKRALDRLGMVDHFAQILPTLSKRFSVHRSVPDFELPPDHDCWKIWPLKHNNLPNTFATHNELFGFKQTGLQIQVAQEKYQKALRGPLKRKAIALDGTEYEQRGVPDHPSFRELSGIYDPDGKWIPRVPNSPEKAIYIEIQHYSICETISWMIGGYDETYVLMDRERDHMRSALVSQRRKLEWQTIIQRLWPQELNFFHIDAPTRRKHCLAHYQAATVSEEEYRFMALQAGLPDEKKAFSDVQELGAWTMDLLWNEVLNRIDRVTAFTRKDDPTFKLKTKENVKGYRVVMQADYMKLIKGVKAGNNEE